MQKFIASALTGLALLAVIPAPASAQGFFDFFFGGGRRHSPPPPAQSYAPPPPSRTYVDPSGDFEDERPRRRSESSTYSAYCVRLCDGRFFPLPKNAGGSSTQLCSAFCPAAKTKVYSGGGIDHAVASDGKRYDDLENAYTYRDKVVGNCTCNGKDAFGLAKIDLKNDATLQKGDIVATKNGLMAYAGTKNNNLAFSPLSGDALKKLAAVKVATGNTDTEAGAYVEEYDNSKADQNTKDREAKGKRNAARDRSSD